MSRTIKSEETINPMAFLSTLSSCLLKSSPLFTKISQLPASHKASNHSFRVACESKDNEQSASRRDVVIGLGGALCVTAAAAGIVDDPFSFAAPIDGPDISKCKPVAPRDSPPIEYCCPPPYKEIIDFKPPQFSKIRVRKPAHLADSDYVKKYEKAVRLMRELPDDDPRNFLQQAKVHCAYCEGGYQQEGFPDIEFQVHSTWLFFPFHRLYLYFFERICGKLIEDPSFVLPFWNYDVEAGMTLPAIFATPGSSLYDPLRDAAHQPPNMIDLNFSGSDSNLSNTDLVSQNLKTMYRQMVSQSRDPLQFFGSVYLAGENPEPKPVPGSIENSPHTAVHRWTGDRTQPKGQDMGIFYAAARDPIFYAHHANVDRLWTIWKKFGGRRRDIDRDDWLNTSFLFYNEDAQLVRARVRDCLDTTKLGYTYQDMDIPWLNSRPRPKKQKLTKLAKKIVDANAAEDPDDRSPSKVSFPVKLDKTVRVTVKRPNKKRRSKKEKDEQDEILEIRDIELDYEQFVKFDVLINDDDDTEISPENTEFAGSFVNVPHLMKHSSKNMNSSKRKANLTLSLNDILEDLEAEDDEVLTVTLVPRAACADVTVGGIEIGLR